MKISRSPRTIALVAMLTAVSIILARLLGFYLTPSLRVSFEYFPILLAGVCFGPAAGAITGALADFLGATVLSGLGFNPLLMVGPTMAGLLAGLLTRYAFGGRVDRWWKFLLVCMIPDLLGNFLWGTFALSLMYGAPVGAYLLVRAPLKLGIAIVDMSLVLVLHRALQPVLTRWKRPAGA